MYLGIDFGKNSTKAVFLDHNGKVRYKCTLENDDSDGESSVQYITEYAGIKADSIKKAVITGAFGKKEKAGAVRLSEVSCQLKYIEKKNCGFETIVDAGDETIKIMVIDNDMSIKRMYDYSNYMVNETGFIRELACNAGCSPDRVRRIINSDESSHEAYNVCRTRRFLEESELFDMTISRRNMKDIFVRTYRNIFRRIFSDLEADCSSGVMFVIGDAAGDRELISALEETTGKNAIVADDPQYVSAIGAGMYARELKEKE